MPSHRARFGYMPTSKEAKQTRTASGEKNPSLHAVSSSAVWRSRRPAGHTCLPAKKQNKQELQAAKRIQACMPSRRAPSGGLQIPVAFWRPRAQSKSTKAFSTKSQEETSHQNLEHELAGRDIPRAQSKRTKASSTNLQKETLHQNLVQFGNPGPQSLLEARDFPRTRQLYWKTRVWCRLSADYVYARPSEGSPRTTIILENKSLKARALRGPPEGSPRSSRKACTGMVKIATLPRVRALDHANPCERLQVSPQCTSKIAILPSVRAFDHANPCEGLQISPQCTSNIATLPSVRAFDHANPCERLQVSNPCEGLQIRALDPPIPVKGCKVRALDHVNPCEGLQSAPHNVSLYLAFVRSTLPIPVKGCKVRMAICHFTSRSCVRPCQFL